MPSVECDGRHDQSRQLSSGCDPIRKISAAAYQETRALGTGERVEFNQVSSANHPELADPA
jgi:hypothetical protein